MRSFIDTEFIENGSNFPISLISLGMVREDGEMFYLINADVSLSALYRHPWLSLNVVPHLPLITPNQGIIAWDEGHPDYMRVVGLDSMAEAARKFIIAEDLPPDERGEPELWAYYGAHDYVALAQMWGSMVELPPRIPMFINDIMQEIARLGRLGVAVTLPAQDPSAEHHALNDALWTREAWRALREGGAPEGPTEEIQ